MNGDNLALHRVPRRDVIDAVVHKLVIVVDEPLLPLLCILDVLATVDYVRNPTKIGLPGQMGLGVDDLIVLTFASQ
jgi:hypothetical protein